MNMSSKGKRKAETLAKEKDDKRKYVYDRAIRLGITEIDCIFIVDSETNVLRRMKTKGVMMRKKILMQVCSFVSWRNNSQSDCKQMNWNSFSKMP